jgi:rare lipoprotein A
VSRPSAPLASPSLLLALLALTGCASSAAPRQARSAPADQSEPSAPPPPDAAAVSLRDGQIYQRGAATYYADSLAGHPTATGEPYDPGAFTAAHRTLPFGAVVDVARPDGRHVAVRINDRGPFVHGRIIDLSRNAARAIGLLGDGTASVLVRVVSLPPPRARRHRRR